MKTLIRIALVAGFILASGAAAHAQAAQDQEVLISIFRIAPGQHLDFLKWQAQQATIAAEAGAPAAEWYVHHNGDAWDFVSITPVQDPAAEDATNERVDELSRQKGLPTGLGAALEFRRFVNFHTDTYAGGPFTIQDLVNQTSER